jgi:hypothetical protein
MINPPVLMAVQIVTKKAPRNGLNTASQNATALQIAMIDGKV